MTGLPDAVPLDAVKAALHSLGIPTDNLVSATFDVGAITVVHRRTDSNGRPFMAGQDVATVTTTIGITRPAP